MRILYVEDNPANVFLVKRVAKMGNHEIINYIDGAEALKKYDDIDPKLILMDVQLSGELSGLDVVRELRSRGVTVPIIAVTAYAMVGDKERCIEAGCDDYLAKPLPVPRLVEMFQMYSELPASPQATESETTEAVETQPATETEEAPAESKADAVTDVKTEASAENTSTDATATSKTEETENTTTDVKPDTPANSTDIAATQANVESKISETHSESESTTDANATSSEPDETSPEVPSETTTVSASGEASTSNDPVTDDSPEPTQTS